MPASNKTTRTVQFRVKDVRFYHNGMIVSNNSPLPLLLQANGVVLCIDNQKNGTRGETIFHHAMHMSSSSIGAKSFISSSVWGRRIGTYFNGRV